jgi:hypothetical protein
MSHPYENLPVDRFWRTGVADLAPLDITGLWKPKIRFRARTRIITAGSCFAQHFSKALVARRYRWLDFEPGPPGLTPAQRKDYHYGTFSFRTGNIYTPRMLLQWLSWAFEKSEPSQDVWETNGRFYDPFRPGVEPGGFDSTDELFASRAQTLVAIREAVLNANVFVFTMGLTEAWQNRETGVEYAVCPGTIAGEFEDSRHVFVNHSFASLYRDLMASIKIMFKANPNLSVLLTVSPVPLTATASGQHVLSATSHSKSLLRAVASAAVDANRKIDYFPSYEIITHPVYRGSFFAPNMRSVLPVGVDHVMECFFRDQATAFGKVTSSELTQPEMPAPVHDAESEQEISAADELRCEEEILAAFAPR